MGVSEFLLLGVITLELERNIMLSDMLWLIGYGPLIYYSLRCMFYFIII